MARARLDALLVSTESNVTYLSGFTGDSTYLLITPKRQYIITDFRYFEQAEEESPHFTLEKTRKGLIKTCAAKINRLRLKTVGFEAGRFSVSNHKALRKELKSARLKPAGDLIESLRMVKDEEEIALIRRAAAAAARGFREMRKRLQPGATEKDAAAELDYQMRKAGADLPGFDSIVAFDERASLPHARPTDKKLRAKGAVLVDWGAAIGKYRSDSTRMIYLAKPGRKQAKIHDVVLEAQQAAIERVRPGEPLKNIDRTARKIISDAGYGPFFGHGLGHGVGLDIHEKPSVHKTSDIKAEEGMIFTIEPGIYLPGEVGVRIEDMVLVTATGCERLADIPRTIEGSIL